MPKTRALHSISPTFPIAMESAPVPALLPLLGMTVAVGLALAVLATVGLGVLATVVDWLPWDAIARIAVLAFALPFAALAWGSWRLLWAYVNAGVEALTGLDLDGSGHVGDVPPAGPAEIVRFVPVRGARVVDAGLEHEGPAIEDVAQYVRDHETRGKGKMNWRGVQMTSGRTCDDDYHSAIIAALERAGLWRGRGPKAAGELIGGVAEALAQLASVA